MPQRGSFGHAAYEYSLELASAAGARRVLLFHHDPSRTDPQVESILRTARELANGTGLAVDLGRDGKKFSLGSNPDGE